jgi:hypothetical protein
VSQAQWLFVLGIVPIFTGLDVRFAWRDALHQVGVQQRPFS